MVALGFLVFAFFFFSFVIAFFLSVLVTTVVFAVWYQSKLEKKKSGRFIEVSYTVMKDDEKKRMSTKKGA